MIAKGLTKHYLNDKFFIKENVEMKVVKYRTYNDALNAVRKNGLNIEFVSDELKNNKKILIETIKRNTNYLKEIKTSTVIQLFLSEPKLLEFLKKCIKVDAYKKLENLKKSSIDNLEELEREKEIIVKDVKEKINIVEGFVSDFEKYIEQQDNFFQQKEKRVDIL